MTILLGGASYSITAGGTGSWSLDTNAVAPSSGVFALVQGNNEVVVTSTDVAGNVASDGSSYVGKSVRVNARVSKVCKKKGCFFIAQEGNSVVRIAFKDYSFFVPTDISGKRVTFVGEVIAREVTAEEADHLAEDIGEDGTEIKSGNVFEIVASSVRVPR